MMGRTLPSWLSLGVLAAIAVGALAVVGWIKPLLDGPDLSHVTIYRPKPVPVSVETTPWLTKVETRIKRETVQVPVEVIRELPAREADRLERDFAITLPDLRSTNRELARVVEIPRAPHGGEMAITVNTEDGTIDGIFRARRAPLIELGGIREAGVELDPIQRTVTGYYRQDLLRVGPAIVHGRVFAGAPMAGGGTAPSYGAAIAVAVRF